MANINRFQDFELPSDYHLGGVTIYKDSIANNKPKITRVCDAIFIEKVVQDANSMEQQLQLLFYAGKSGVKAITIPAEQLGSRQIEGLSKFGMDITTKNKNEVNEFLISQRKLLQTDLAYQTVGWSQLNNQTVFAMDKVIVPMIVGSSNVMLDSTQYQLVPQGVHYQLNDKNCPIHNDLSNNVNLKLGLVLGLSAALVPIINRFKPDIGTLIFALKGQSTSGKTTTAQLAASVAGPISGDGSLFNSWMNTQNAVTIKLNNNFGIPLVYDELSVYRGTNITSLLYNISQGLEKARANKNGEIRPQKRWQTVVISTGEQSIIEKSSQNDGILARTLEFEVDHWTSSAEQSDRIKQFATQNNGWWLRDFIEAVFGQDIQGGINMVESTFNEMARIANEQLINANFKNRIADKVAVIGTTAKLINDCMGFAIDAQKIQELVIEYCGLKQSADIGERSFNDIMQALISNQKRIQYDGQYVEANLIGFFDASNTEYLVVDVIANELKKMLTDLQYEDTAIILKKWKKSGHLVAGSDRLTSRKSINKSRITFYRLKIEPSEVKNFTALSTDIRLRYKTKADELLDQESLAEQIFGKEAVEAGMVKVETNDD
ncbi:DUF927 domain-containing protein [Latilactobacillus sakei]|uniref:DUF927 domain-containing protein n=1 Tax=Latilactobacillus sakei TaxID=1599 RepID=A0AAF0GQN3_LATSK|nr:DUF927 domain-containing protein [Latilactobacillus sakei]WGI19243.1 DUF927 domain-containing protein [Latilactobacillus sakei]